jgi:hypothetical protein
MSASLNHTRHQHMHRQFWAFIPCAAAAALCYNRQTSSCVGGQPPLLATLGQRPGRSTVMQPTNTKPSKGLLVGWDLNRSPDRLCRRCNSTPLPSGDRAPGAPTAKSHVPSTERAPGEPCYALHRSPRASDDAVTSTTAKVACVGPMCLLLRNMHHNPQRVSISLNSPLLLDLRLDQSMPVVLELLRAQFPRVYT